MTFFENEEKNRQFIQNNLMGPNALLILAELLDKIQLTPGMRILDLACGTGLTSMYLAKNTGALVFAADLWINPADNYKRFKQAGLEQKIIPLHLDASQPLPFAHDYFDAVISIDSFHYFGTEAGYLDNNLIPFVKADGTVAVGMVGRRNELDDAMLKKMTPYLQGETNFHSKEWWKELWQKTKHIEIKEAFSMKCHQKAWQDWLDIQDDFVASDIEMMKADDGKFFDTIGLVARVTKPAPSSEPNPWQSILG